MILSNICSKNNAYHREGRGRFLWLFVSQNKVKILTYLYFGSVKNLDQKKNVTEVSLDSLLNCKSDVGVDFGPRLNSSHRANETLLKLTDTNRVKKKRILMIKIRESHTSLSRRLASKSSLFEKWNIERSRHHLPGS